VAVLGTKNSSVDKPDADGRQESYDVVHTVPDLEGYGKWLEPGYPFLRLYFQRPRDGKLLLPKGLEVIACLNPGSLEALYLSKASHTMMSKMRQTALVKAGFIPEPDETATLEQVLQQYDLRQIPHVNRAAGETNVLAKEKYAVMPMYDVIEHFRMMGGEQYHLPQSKRAAFEEALHRQHGIKPFHLGQGGLYYTAVQAEMARKAFFPDVDISPLAPLRRRTSPHPLGYTMGRAK